jgi:CIC family chloride channel protein
MKHWKMMTKNRAQILFQRILTSRSLRLGLLSGLVGLLSGAGVWLFKFLIEIVKKFSFTTLIGWLPTDLKWMLALVPAVGGVLVGLLLHYFGGKQKVGGTAGIIQSVEIAGGRLRYQHLPVNTAAAVLSIGTGASVGPEDPSVQIGANLGSFFGQKLRLNEEQTSVLVAAGAAAAIAAAFNAPIAGVFFALEIIIGDLSGSSLGMILVASVISSVFTQAVSGTSPAFQVHAYAMHSGWEIPLYIGLGLLAGPISALYVKLLYSSQDFFARIPLPRWIQTAFAGLIIGVVGLFLPQVFGVGYDTITAILSQQQMTFWLLIALLVAKLVLTPISIGGGFAGGVFAPSLFVGAALGGAFGMAMNALFPSLGITSSAFALVGMAAVLAGAVHAPLTASILLFEMTSDYRIILPLLLAVAISLMISQKIQSRSVYSLGLARRGFYLNRGKEIDVLETIQVKEAMTGHYQTLCESDSIETARKKFAGLHSRGLPVENAKGDLCGILTVGDLESLPLDKESGIVGHYHINPAVSYPQETLSDALKRMSQLNVGQLPVVMPESPKTLVGMLYREDVIHAYAVASQRRLEQRYSVQQKRLDTITPEQVQVTEITVERGASITGKYLKEIQFPSDSVIASLRRKNQVIIQRGNSVIKEGDVLVVVAQGPALETIRKICTS